MLKNNFSKVRSAFYILAAGYASALVIFSFEVTLPPATPPKYRARYSLRGPRWFGGRRRRTKSDSPLITHSRSIPTAVVARFRQGASVVRRRRGAKGKPETNAAAAATRLRTVPSRPCPSGRRNSDGSILKL